jgi:hypothetical protein
MGRELMKYLVVMMSALLLFSVNASAQEEAGATTEPAAASEPVPAETAPAEDAPANPPEEDKRSPYYKKVKGWLWIEGVVGISSYDPDQFGALSLGSPTPGGAPKEKGPQWGFSLGTGFGGGFFLGWYYRQADYNEYKLMKTGVEFQPTIRIPYVHIMFRVDIGFAKMFSGNPWGLTNFDSGGVDTTFGVGLVLHRPVGEGRRRRYPSRFVGQRSTDGGYFRAHLPLHRRPKRLVDCARPSDAAMASFVNVVDQGAGLRRRRLRHDTVAQVENVPGTACCAVEDLGRAATHDVG